MHLDKICEKLLRKYGNEFIDSEDFWIGADRWICHLATKLLELGYVEAKPFRANFDGSEILDEDDDNSDFRKVVGEELFKKACAKNLEIEKGLREYKSEGFAIPNNHLPVQKTPEKP